MGMVEMYVSFCLSSCFKLGPAFILIYKDWTARTATHQGWYSNSKNRILWLTLPCTSVQISSRRSAWLETMAVSGITSNRYLTHTCNEYGTSFPSSQWDCLAMGVFIVFTTDFTHDDITRIETAIKMENTSVFPFELTSYWPSLAPDGYFQYLIGIEYSMSHFLGKTHSFRFICDERIVDQIFCN